MEDKIEEFHKIIHAAAKTIFPSRDFYLYRLRYSLDGNIIDLWPEGELYINKLYQEKRPYI
jgi:hypothetical protein